MDVQHSLRLQNVGPILDADVAFGDLTVLVGPQATGKSIFLQLLKVVLDGGVVAEELRQYGLEWQDWASFLEVYLGEGMSGIWVERSKVEVDGQAIASAGLLAPDGHGGERLFYAPAQRVLALREGWPLPFQAFTWRDPYVVRRFSEQVRRVADLAGTDAERQPDRWPIGGEEIGALEHHIFRQYWPAIEAEGFQKRLVLRARPGLTDNDLARRQQPRSLPFMVWSAGQREFVPLLLACHHLLFSVRERYPGVEWVVIEEPEAGLHPQGLAAVMLLVVDLLDRGYRVCLSTHSASALDYVWALRVVRECDPQPVRVLDLLDVKATPEWEAKALRLLGKELRVHYFDAANRKSRDISELDPGSEDSGVAGWGGLSEFSGRAADIVADAVNAGHRRGER